ncbi:pirin [Sphingomonas sp. Leaf231]|uniref:pirin family protein n=1 Tax=Sphingomonas sp. Leaf231 TaxID=1736301 RepID=UPI0006F95526|nr:pirin family protein [Sphingomonas sp. Leaf231]KQN93664.1 pirin [Sphingomonas sp. Leaf231]
MSTRDDLVLQTLEPATHDLGGFKVYRTLPHRDRTMVGPFLFFDQMGPAHLPPGNGVDVRPHPHIGLSTVTYLFEGAFQHRDSLGSDVRIAPGAVNLMTAGAGIVHSERSPDDVRVDGPRLDGIQTWLALPDGQEDRAPAFEHVPADALPIITAGGATARVVMGSLWGATAPVTAYAETIYADIVLEPGSSVPIDDSTDERAIYLASGTATLDGLTLEPQRLYVLRPGITATLSSPTGGRAMLAGGAAFPSPRHVWWNFVHSSRDAIREAKRAWKAGEFASVPNDSEWIPLPEVPKTVSYP